MLRKIAEWYRLRRHPYREARILLTGDTIVHRLRLSTLLKGGGFPVRLATGPLDDLGPLRRELPATGLLLVNLCSSSFDGFSLVRRLRDEGITGRVLTWAFENVLDAGPRKREELQALGVRGFLDHSLSPEEILNRLNALYYSEINTRRFARRLLYVPASFEVEGGHRGLGYVTSLSKEGLFLQTLEPARIGSGVRVRFRLPDEGEPIEIATRVIHRGTHIQSELPAPGEGMGLRILDVAPQARERIERFTEPAGAGSERVAAGESDA